MSPVRVTLAGRTYPSLSAAARAAGITRQALAMWLARRSRGLKRRPASPSQPPGTILVDGPCLHVAGCVCGGKGRPRVTGHRVLVEAEECARRVRAREVGR